jgi:hypothetical protein
MLSTGFGAAGSAFFSGLITVMAESRVKFVVSLFAAAGGFTPF